MKKMDKIPQHWSYQRKVLSDLLLNSEAYEESVKKGLPFFTLKELGELRKKYWRGMTWKDIDAELSKKGVILKQPTFRKYIQEKKIPPSIYYRSSKTGREAIYPKDTIEHINLIQYVTRVADDNLINHVIKVLSEQTVTLKEALEEQDEIGGGNLREAVFMYLRGHSNDIEQAIEKVLNGHPEVKEKVLSDLGEIYDSYHKGMKKWLKLLEECKIPVSN